MKVLVYGAGVLGSLLAARLHSAGYAVSLLARGERLVGLREHGLVLQDALTDDRTEVRVPLVERLAPEDVYDLIVVIMRKNRARDILPELAVNLHSPTILFMGNNVAGADEYVQALGARRVLLGFIGAGGLRRGHIVEYVAGTSGRKATATLGEVNGYYSFRLSEVGRVFESAGFKVNLTNRIDAWLKTHFALVGPIAGALYLVGTDNYRLARTRDAVVLGVRGAREALGVLHALDIPITPPAARMYEWLPEPVLVPLAQRLFATKLAEVAMAGHAEAARDEMQALAEEFRVLKRASGIETPTLDRLFAQFDSAMPTLPEASAEIPLDWREVWIGLGAVAGVVALARMARGSRRGRDRAAIPVAHG